MMAHERRRVLRLAHRVARDAGERTAAGKLAHAIIADARQRAGLAGVRTAPGWARGHVPDHLARARFELELHRAAARTPDGAARWRERCRTVARHHLTRAAFWNDAARAHGDYFNR